jgi:putative ABC transport system ATP-binding protein
MNMIEIRNLVKKYGDCENTVYALNGISLSIKWGEFVAIVGASGSGKSTLLNLLGGLDIPTSGDIIINNNDISKLKKSKLTVFRRRNIGFIFQNYSLLPVLNAFDNIALPRVLDKGTKIDPASIEKIMKELGIWEKRERYPNELSGGQQQRVAIARALVTEPALILADEPTGNLDSKTALEVVSKLKECCHTYKQTIIMVTHNEDIAQSCDKIIQLTDGMIAREDDSL